MHNVTLLLCRKIDNVSFTGKPGWRVEWLGLLKETVQRDCWGWGAVERDGQPHKVADPFRLHMSTWQKGPRGLGMNHAHSPRTELVQSHLLGHEGGRKFAI